MPEALLMSIATLALVRLALYCIKGFKAARATVREEARALKGYALQEHINSKVRWQIASYVSVIFAAVSFTLAAYLLLR